MTRLESKTKNNNNNQILIKKARGKMKRYLK